VPYTPAIDDDDPRSVGLERLGATDAFTGFLLELLRAQGWDTGGAVPTFGGRSFLVEARKQGHEVRAARPTAAEAALAVFEECARRMGSGDDVIQLPLPGFPVESRPSGTASCTIARPAGSLRRARGSRSAANRVRAGQLGPRAR